MARFYESTRSLRAPSAHAIRKNLTRQIFGKTATKKQNQKKKKENPVRQAVSSSANALKPAYPLPATFFLLLIFLDRALEDPGKTQRIRTAAGGKRKNLTESRAGKPPIPNRASPPQRYRIPAPPGKSKKEFRRKYRTTTLRAVFRFLFFFHLVDSLGHHFQCNPRLHQGCDKDPQLHAALSPENRKRMTLGGPRNCDPDSKVPGFV